MQATICVVTSPLYIYLCVVCVRYVCRFLVSSVHHDSMNWCGGSRLHCAAQHACLATGPGNYAGKRWQLFVLIRFLLIVTASIIFPTSLILVDGYVAQSVYIQLLYACK